MRFTLGYQILSQLHLDMETLSVTEDATEAQPDVEMENRCEEAGTKRTSSTSEDCVDKINMEMRVVATIAGIRFEPTQCKSAKCSGANTKGHSHKAKRDKAQPRTVTPERADTMRVSEP